MDLEDNNMSQQNYVHCSNFPHDEATINKQSTDEDNYHHPLPTPPQPPNCKRRLSCDNGDIGLQSNCLMVLAGLKNTRIFRGARIRLNDSDTPHT